MKVIYKITYPNGKIYIGKDLTGSLGYFGSVNSKILKKDFPISQQLDFTARKQLLWRSNSTPDAAVNKKEIEFILKYESNNPAIGYNRWPKFKKKPNSMHKIKSRTHL